MYVFVSRIMSSGAQIGLGREYVRVSKTHSSYFLSKFALIEMIY